MSRLLAALRRIEARSDTVGAAVAVDAHLAPRNEDDPVVASPLPPQESHLWPGDIVYDPQAEYPGHWIQQASAWPAVRCETEAEPADSAPWPDPGFVCSAKSPIADEQDIDELELPGEDSVEEVLACEPQEQEEELPSIAEPLKVEQAVIVVEPEPTEEETSAAMATPDEVVAEVTARAAKSAAPVTDETPEEPVVSVRLPGFGRPNPRARIAGQRMAAEGFRRPALVPFLPPQQRPLREACEGILTALPQGNSVALVLAWTDEELDHCALSARLAEIMADRLDDPVLVIDIGPKRRLSTLLQAPVIGSLTEAMVGFVSWRDQIVQTSTAGLCLLPSGPNDFDADPVAVARLVEACKEDFGIVLVVGGALSDIPENVLTACDVAVLLVEAGYSSAAKTTEAIQGLRRSGTDVAGCLLTGVGGKR